MKVKISSKSARLRFHGCDPTYIKNVCRASCCQSSTSPSGIMVTVHPSEEAQIRARGVNIVNGFIQPKFGTKKCPFKNADDLCGIHFTPDKPFGCIASPFTLNSNNTLIVRNRYRMLKCYDDGPAPIPAYKAFRASLDLIFGKQESARICDALDSGAADFYAEMQSDSYNKLKQNDEAKKMKTEVNPPVGDMQIHCKYDSLMDVDELRPHPKNRNEHPKEQIQRLAKILAFQGIRAPIIVSELSGYIVKGHGTLMAIKLNKWTEAPIVIQSFDTQEQEYAFVQSDNAIAAWAELDLSSINSDLGDLGPDFDIDLLGIKDFKLDAEPSAPPNESLVESFGIPPFSVFDTRQGYWQERKRKWHEMGIKSLEGRSDALTFAKGRDESKNIDPVSQKLLDVSNGTSIFDPVLAELIFSWFSPKGGIILDPFAGGSVRGIVASKLERQYIGLDLRLEQIEENRAQALEICMDPMPVWHCGDSRLIHNHCHDVLADLVMSCPPYADLEVYSDDERDISNMEYGDFLNAYNEIIEKTCSLLKDNAFACFVVGEVRNKRSGIYRNFVSDTINAFLKSGLEYYNEAILVNNAATAGLRARPMFNASRKLVKVHQNILIFIKGDPKIATQYCGPVDIPDSDEAGVGADQ